MALQVNAGAIVVPVKGADRYLYRGAILPEGVDAKDIKRLKSIGLVKDVKVQTKPRAAASTNQSESEDKTQGQSESEDEGNASGESDGSAEEQTEADKADAAAEDAPKTRSRSKK